MTITNLQEALPGDRVIFDKDQPHALTGIESSCVLVTHMRG